MSRLLSRRTHRCLTFAIIAMLTAFSVGLASAPVNAASPNGNASERHCIAKATRVGTPVRFAVPVAVCFPTFAQALSAATAGSTQLSAGFKAKDLTRGQIRPSVQTVISIDFVDAQWSGNTLTWYVDNDVGCANFDEYWADTMPLGWNDVVSSAQMYDSCNFATHFEHTGFAGAYIDCLGNGCYTMGAMNDATSSEHWRK